jgi:hypothetical protein
MVCQVIVMKRRTDRSPPRPGIIGTTCVWNELYSTVRSFAVATHIVDIACI